MNTPALINYVPVALKKTPVIYKILVMVMMITLVGGSLTYIMTYTNVGITDHFYMDWFTSFLSAVLVMAPIGLAMTASINVFMTKLLPTASELKRNLVISVFMALNMELLMAFVTATNNIGFANTRLFFIQRG